MPRTLPILLFSALVMVAACKKPDKPAGAKPDESKVVDSKPTPPAESAKPAAPGLPPGASSDPAKPDPAAPADPSDPSSAPTGKNTELQDKGFAMMKRVGDLFAADATDCDKLASDLRSLVASNKELLAEWNAMEKTLPTRERAAYETRNKPAFDAVFAKMAPAVKACGSNENFLAALRDVPGR